MTLSNAAMPRAGSLTVGVISDDPTILLDWTPTMRAERVELALATAAPERLDYSVVVLDVRARHRHLEAAHLVAMAHLALIVLGPASSGDEGMRYLDLGATDYVSAASQPNELEARIRSVARYGSNLADDWLFGDSTSVSLTRQEVRKNGRTVHLRPTEYRIVEALALSPGQIISHREVISHVWGGGGVNAQHYLRVYVRQIRAKLEHEGEQRRFIQTVPGIGYRLEVSRSLNQRSRTV